jgi:hypothetical protein
MNSLFDVPEGKMYVSIQLLTTYKVKTHHFPNVPGRMFPISYTPTAPSDERRDTATMARDKRRIFVAGLLLIVVVETMTSSQKIAPKM